MIVNIWRNIVQKPGFELKTVVFECVVKYNVGKMRRWNEACNTRRPPLGAAPCPWRSGDVNQRWRRWTVLSLGQE